MSNQQATLDQKSVTAARMLGVEMIEASHSGHPGIVLDAAPMAYTLFEYHMRFNPKQPKWINRDRFVLSAGHGSALLYSLLHLNGFDLTVDDLKAFRQMGSKTPGHPEYGWTPDVDASTGPLGQGLGMAVGMAIAEKHLAAQCNRPGMPVIDHYTYALAGDGDLMEGISQEALDIAGNLQLNKLIVLYDSNDVSLDGPLSMSTHDNVEQRVKAASWNYERVEDGNDLAQIDAALWRAKRSDKPTLIEVKTVIGYGAPKQGTNKVHGTPVGQDGLAVLKEKFDWHEPSFTVPQAVYDHFQELVAAKEKQYQRWLEMWASYQQQYPQLAAQLMNDEFKLSDDALNYQPGEKIATRLVCDDALQEIARQNPMFWGGAADLASSNKTLLKNDDNFAADNPLGRNLRFGVREFGMAAALNGITLHGGTRAFGSTFLVFSDYLKGAVRLAALMKIPTTFVFSHDSLAVGEDGPTHEPVEQLAALRSMPGVDVYRPADANETIASWQVIGKTTDRPSVIVTSRQGLPVLAAAKHAPVERGAYILAPAQTNHPAGILIASGSEVSLALQARERLAKEGIDVQVVSMPCQERFLRQSKQYQEMVLPPRLDKRLAIEMGSSMCWHRFVGLNGMVMGVDEFGTSAPGEQVIEKFGFTPERVAAAFKQTAGLENEKSTQMAANG